MQHWATAASTWQQKHSSLPLNFTSAGSYAAAAAAAAAAGIRTKPSGFEVILSCPTIRYCYIGFTKTLREARILKAAATLAVFGRAAAASKLTAAESAAAADLPAEEVKQMAIKLASKPGVLGVMRQSGTAVALLTQHELATAEAAAACKKTTAFAKQASAIHLPAAAAAAAAGTKQKHAVHALPRIRLPSPPPAPAAAAAAAAVLVTLQQQLSLRLPGAVLDSQWLGYKRGLSNAAVLLHPSLPRGLFSTATAAVSYLAALVDILQQQKQQQNWSDLWVPGLAALPTAALQPQQQVPAAAAAAASCSAAVVAAAIAQALQAAGRGWEAIKGGSERIPLGFLFDTYNSPQQQQQQQHQQQQQQQVEDFSLCTAGTKGAEPAAGPSAAAAAADIPGCDDEVSSDAAPFAAAAAAAGCSKACAAEQLLEELIAGYSLPVNPQLEKVPLLPQQQQQQQPRQERPAVCGAYSTAGDAAALAGEDAARHAVAAAEDAEVLQALVEQLQGWCLADDHDAAPTATAAAAAAEAAAAETVLPPEACSLTDTAESSQTSHAAEAAQLATPASQRSTGDCSPQQQQQQQQQDDCHRQQLGSSAARTDNTAAALKSAATAIDWQASEPPPRQQRQKQQQQQQQQQEQQHQEDTQRQRWLRGQLSSRRLAAPS
jgi:hypothetical protein